MASPIEKSLKTELDLEKIGPVATEIEAPTHVITRALFDIWSNECRTNNPPKWRAFSAGKIKELTRFVYALDSIDEGRDFRVRFMGSAIVQSIGGDYTGVTLSDYGDDPSLWRTDVYREVLKRRAPIFTAVNLGDFDREFIKTECVLLPVADNSGAFSIVMCAAAAY